MYNPFDILLFIKNQHRYENYWFETGTPTFLVNLIQQKKYFLPHFKQIVVEQNIINSFDIKNLAIETIMFQAGYLTIKTVQQKRNRLIYRLDFPNLEVKQSFHDYLLNSWVNTTQKNTIADDLYDLFESGQIEQLEPIIKRLFASIAYTNHIKNNIAEYEGFYASVLYAYFATLGLTIIAEDITSQGRVDLTLQTGNKTYIFEFKVTDEAPLKQIKEKRYFQKYSGEVYIVGINFDRNERNIKQFVWEKIAVAD
ncbi:MAG: PD-(D/E)XK nuclease domain-containing protein [Methylococcales bacterium]|nr:PD-(D/E)XK nuclease domain-containing protein [Methylococcales bacterium]